MSEGEAAVGKVYVVTGANKGIGLCIVRGLCKNKGEKDVVYLCSRDKDRGEAAVKQLVDEGLQPTLAIVDLEDVTSIEALAATIKDAHGGVDGIVNNAGIAYHADSDVSPKEQILKTVNTNFFGTLNVCKHLFPLLKNHGRVVNIGSQAGHMVYGRILPELLEQLNAADVKMADLSFIMKAYLASMEALGDGGAADEAAARWPSSPYAFSKLAVHYMTIIQQKLFDIDPDKDVLINAVCPGFCNTDFTKGRGPRPAEVGAETPIWALTLPPKDAANPKGQFLFDKKPIELGAKVLPIFKQKPLPEKLDEEVALMVELESKEAAAATEVTVATEEKVAEATDVEMPEVPTEA